MNKSLSEEYKKYPNCQMFSSQAREKKFSDLCAIINFLSDTQKKVCWFERERVKIKHFVDVVVIRRCFTRLGMECLS